MTDYKDLYEICDQALREGRGRWVARTLIRHSFAKVPREWRLPMANLCRRAGIFRAGLRLLTPLIDKDLNRWRVEANPNEFAEYAALLMKNGSYAESLAILSKINPAEVPEALLFRAFGQMAQWNYDAAALDLRQYLTTKLDPYSSAVAEVNLSASLFYTHQLEEASQIIDKLMVQTESEGYHRLRANCLQLRSAIHLDQNQLARAEADLEQAGVILSQQDAPDQLLVDKYKAFLAALRLNSLAPLQKLRQEATERRRWETVRDCDRFSLRIQFDSYTFQSLFFGTPYTAFRENLKKDFAIDVLANSFRRGPRSGPCLNIQTGEFDEGAYPTLSARTRLIVDILTRDFYRPIHLGSLFADLFPGDHFDVFSSQNRVHQAVWRARRELAELKVPITIVYLNGTYLLQAAESLSFLFPLSRFEGVPRAERIALLTNAFGNKEFTSEEAARVLGISRSAFLRWSKNLRSEILTHRFNGPARLYKVA